MTLLEKIVDNLSKVIPRPAQKAAKPGQSFRGLKVGQLLRLKPQQSIHTPELNSVKAGSFMVVTEVNSRGAKLKPAHPWGEPLRDFGYVWWRLPEWDGMFERVRKVKKPKVEA